MKRNIFLAIAVVAAVFASCNKEVNITRNQSPVKLVPKTFTVSVDETRTSLGENGKSILWEEGDVIRVIGATASGTVSQHVFTLSSGAGTGSATFTGEVEEGEETFYAIYPNYEIDPENNKGTFASGYLAMKNGDVAKAQSADAGSIDKSHLVMTASLNQDAFTFRHSACFFKFTMGNDDIKEVAFETTGDIRFGKRLVIKKDDGKVNSVEGAESTGILKPATGTSFVKGETYYIAFYPKSYSARTIKNLKITYTQLSGATKSVSVPSTATDFLQTAVVEGTIYNIGTPTVEFLPAISASNVILGAEATSGSITYEITNPVEGGVLTAELSESSEWLTVGEVSDGSVAFTCSANTGDPRSAVVVLTYTYNTSETAIKNVTVSQDGSSVSASEDYSWDFSTDGWQAALLAQAPAAKDTKASNWTVSYSGLAYNAGTDDRWSVNGYIQPNGSGYYKSSSKRRYFLFSTNGGGYVYVTVGSNASSDKTADVCAQLGMKDSPDFSKSVTSSASSLKTVELGPFSDGGDIAVFLGGSGHRIYKIEFHTSQITD